MAAWKKLQNLVKTKELFDLVPTSNVFTPTKEDVIESRLRLRYSSTCDSYYRDWSNAIDPSSISVLPGWERGLFSLDNIYRRIDEENGLVYLDRRDHSATGNLKWQFNIGCCGLLVDQISLKVNAVADFGGEIIVTLIGDNGKQRVKYQGEGSHVTFDGLANSSLVTLSIHLVGDPSHVTRLFPQNIMKGMDYPLDLQFVLKPRLESLGKPRILLGLMYSNAQEIQVDARHYKEKHSKSPGKGFLHVHFLQGRDLFPEKPIIPESVIKCFCLPDPKKTTKCRTKPKKGREPIWNEQFLIVGVPYHELKRMSLEVCLTESHATPIGKVNVFGGLRMSLGVEKVAASQKKNVSQVLKAFLGKQQTADVKANEVKTQKTETDTMKNVVRNDGNIIFAQVFHHKAKNEETQTTENRGNALDSDSVNSISSNSSEKQKGACGSEDTKLQISEEAYCNSINTRNCSTPSTEDYNFHKRKDLTFKQESFDAPSSDVCTGPEHHSSVSINTEKTDSSNNLHKKISIFSYESNLYNYEPVTNQRAINSCSRGLEEQRSNCGNFSSIEGEVNEVLSNKMNNSETSFESENMTMNIVSPVQPINIEESGNESDIECMLSYSSQIDCDELVESQIYSGKGDSPLEFAKSLRGPEKCNTSSTIEAKVKSNINSSFEEVVGIHQNENKKTTINSRSKEDLITNQHKQTVCNGSEESDSIGQIKNKLASDDNFDGKRKPALDTRSEVGAVSDSQNIKKKNKLPTNTDSENDLNKRENKNILALENSSDYDFDNSQDNGSQHAVVSKEMPNGHLNVNISPYKSILPGMPHQNSTSLPCSPFKLKSERVNANSAQNKIETIQRSVSESSVYSRKKSARNSIPFSSRFSIRKSYRESKEERKKKKENVRKELQEIMFDATSPEITQWEMVIERPRQWIFCWQLLRDLQPIHHKL